MISFQIFGLQFSSVLGRGAYKTVYHAFDSDEALEVAWNKLHVERLQKHELEKVSNEVKLLERIKHKNIIRFDCTLPSTERNGVKSLDFITEQMTSGTLKDYLKKAKAIKLKVIRRWCSNILEAIAYLHAQQPPIMHRDLKCDNIFINGHVGEVKIGDLGLSGVKQRDKADSVIGTPEFMAPELYESSYTEKVDIYAFGMCLLEMVTMEYPYSECNNFVQIFKKVFDGKKPKVFDRIKPGPIKGIIAACLQREEYRPSAAQLLQDPLFKDWDQDDGRENNLSLLIRRSEPNGNEENSQQGSNVAVSGNVIEWSDPLDRTLMISIADGGSSTGSQTVAMSSQQQATEVSVVAAQENETGGFKVGLTIPIGNQIKRVEFEFDPFRETPSRLAQELVDEFRLDGSQHGVIENEIERQIKEAREKRNATSRNATPQPAVRNVSPVADEAGTNESISNLSSDTRASAVRDTSIAPIQSTTGTGSIVEGGDIIDNYTTSNASIPQSHAEGISESRAQPEGLLVDQVEAYENSQADAKAGFYEDPALVSSLHGVNAVTTLEGQAQPPAVAQSNSSHGNVTGHPGNQNAAVQIVQSDAIQATTEVSVSRHVSSSSAIGEGSNRVLNKDTLSDVTMAVPVRSSSQEISHRQTPSVASHPQQPISIAVTPSDPPAPHDGLAAHRESLPLQSIDTHSAPLTDVHVPIAPVVPTGSPVQNANSNISTPSGTTHATTISHQVPPPQSSPLPVPQQPSAVHASNTQSSSALPNYHPAPITQVSSAISSIPSNHSENTISHAQPPLPPIQGTQSATIPVGSSALSPAELTADQYVNRNAIDNTEFVSELASVRSTQHVSYTDAASDVTYRNTTADSQLLEVGQQSRGSAVYNSHASLSSLPIETTAISSISHSASEQVLRTNQTPASDLNSPHRSISAPAGSISVDKSVSFLSHQSDVSAALSAVDASVLHTEQPAEPVDTSKGSNQVLEQSRNIQHVIAPHIRSPDSRPPSINIVVVGGDRRSSNSEMHPRPRHITGANLSAQSLPEFGRNEPAAVPRSSSMSANVAEASNNSATYQNVRENDPSLLPSNSTLLSVPTRHIIHSVNRGSIADSPLIAAPITMGRRSSSWRSSQSENSINDITIRASPSDTTLGSTYDQKWISACLELMEHSSKGRYSSVLQKLEQGVPAQFADYDRRTPLHIASAKGHVEVCKLLIERRANIGAVDRWGRTPLSDATKNGHDAVAKLLKANGAIEDMDMDSDVASLQMLQHAAKGDLDAVRRMLVAGANAKFQDYDRRTALHLACTEGHEKVAELLLMNDADWSAKDSLKRTPVDDALRNGNLKVLRVLRQYGADIPRKLLGTHSDSQHQLGLDLVENAAKGRINAVRKCLRNGANPNFQDYDKRTPLHLASVEGHVHIVEVLLQSGADPSMTDRWNATPRDGALKESKMAVVDELDNWEARIARSNILAVNADLRPIANGHTLRGFDAHAGNLDDLRMAVGQNSVMGSIPMHVLADGFVDRLSSSTPNPEVLPAVEPKKSPAAQNPPVNFEKQEAIKTADIEKQVHLLFLQTQHKFSEEVRKLREGNIARSESSNLRLRSSAHQSEGIINTGQPQTYAHSGGILALQVEEIVMPGTGEVTAATNKSAGATSTTALMPEHHEVLAKTLSTGRKALGVQCADGKENAQAKEVASELMDSIISAVCTTKGS